MIPMSKVALWIGEAVSAHAALLENQDLHKVILGGAAAVVSALRGGGRVLFCGNGGSAADAQHLAAELCGRFSRDRPPLDGEALHVNTSYITAVANDYGYEFVYERLLRARGRRGDVLIALSTSGNSANVVRAMHAAREMGIVTIGLTGANPGKMGDVSDYLVCVPSNITPRIQELHILVGHVLCQIVEACMFEA